MSDTPDGAADWQIINDLFHQALQEPPEHRTAFLEKACSRPELRTEVLSLLAHESTTVIKTPAPGINALQMITPDPLVGQKVGQYQIRRRLGEGGMGVVYLAHDTRLGRDVALKALSAQFTNDPSRRERLRREARAAAVVGDPGIATVFALEEFGEELYIAFEYVPGRTLRELLHDGPLPPAQVLDIATQLTRSLAVAHGRGVVHRDLKPENVIVSASGKVKILDLGLARITLPTGGHMGLLGSVSIEMTRSGSALTKQGTFLGTPAYMSPEQICGDVVDGRSDLFSLGIMLYELLTGANPFAGRSYASTIASILERSPTDLGLRVPAGVATAPELAPLRRAVDWCLMKEVPARCPSAVALLQVLTLAEAAPPRVPSNAPAAPAAWWWWQFHQGFTAAAYAALLIAVWFVRESVSGRTALTVFVVALVSATAAITLRLHAWFSIRSYGALAATDRRSRAWTRAADWLFASALAGGAFMVHEAHVSLALILIGAAVVVVIASTVIEPSTERAAFGPG